MPASSKLTVKLLVIVLLEISAKFAVTALLVNVLALTTFAPVRLPPVIVILPPAPVVLKLPAFTLPAKLAVLPASSRLTVRLLAVTLLETFI